MKFYETLRLKIRKLYIKLTKNIRRKKINCDDFTIISNNCWGGTVYQSYGLKYNSPTAGLFFMAEDYIKFVSNLKHYMSIDVQFIDYKESKRYNYNREDISFPVGKIDDVEIYFMHYKTEEEAKEKWDRRKNRINYNKILFKFSNQNNCSVKEIQQFMNLPMKNKICFVNRDFHVNGTIMIKQLFKTDDIKASYEPFGKSKYININEIINTLK